MAQQQVPEAVVVDSQPVAVTIPENVKVGQVIAVAAPGGEAHIAVPDGVKPGQVIQVVMPVAATTLTGLQGLAGFLGNSAKLEVNQKIRLAEALTGGCCEQQNIFDVKLEGRDGPRVLTAKEKSSCCDRVCCKPYHSFLIHLSPTYDEEQVLITLERKGCEFSKCCFSPKCCLPYCSCSECCTEEIVIHEGKATGKPSKLVGGNPVAVIKQPMQCCASRGCTPTLEYFHNDGKTKEDPPFAKIVGPTCFGGCSELCFTSSFTYSSASGSDSASIVHLTPRSCGEFCKACCTDSDNYAIDLSATKTPEAKAHALLGSLVLDTMFFEIDQGLCHYDNASNACVITCCLCFCYGCLCPCECHIPLPKGAPPSPENSVGAPPSPETQGGEEGAEGVAFAAENDQA